MKKLALAFLCALMIFALASCATVNSDNSFQGSTAVVTAQPTTAEQTDAQPQTTDAPVPTDAHTAAPGYNG